MCVCVCVCVCVCRHHLRRRSEYSDKEILRPGFTRLNLPFFADSSTAQFVLDAVHFVADHGWKLLPRYPACCGPVCT